MKASYLLLLLIMHMGAASAQTSLSQLDKKSQRKYQKALKCLKKGHEEKAITRIEEVIKDNPGFEEGIEKLVGIYTKNGDAESTSRVLTDLAAASGEMRPGLAMSLSNSLESQDKYDEAIDNLKKALEGENLKESVRIKLQRRLDELSFRKNAYANPIELNPIKLSGAINTDKIEYHPAITADGNTMIYVTKEGSDENLYYSSIKDGSFKKGEPIRELNTPLPEGAFTISQDGRILIFSAEDRRDSQGGYDLYISFKEGAHWTEPKNMGPAINSRWKDSTPSLAPDNKTLYFASRRPGGHGGTDIWVATLNNRNRWNPPVNLGTRINTAENDETPFIHPDSRTLYFASEGHIGLGSYDLFVSRQDENQEWSTPKNLGYPLNTDKREGGLFVDLSGLKAYYSSQIEFAGDEKGGDLYAVDLPLQLRPDLVTYIKVEVRDAKTKGLILAQTQLVDLYSKTEDVVIQTDVSGKMLTIIKLGEYALKVSKSGYLFHSENIKVNTASSYLDPFHFKIFLEPIPEKEAEPVTQEEAPKVVLKNIFFKSGSAELLGKSDSEIDNLYQLLIGQPELKIKILGHTDDVGKDADNMRLSTARAKAIYDKLISKGITQSRLQYQGLGESNPIADNKTEEGRQLNRRTEFFIVN